MGRRLQRGIMSNIDINLGNIELATDYLFNNYNKVYADNNEQCKKTESIIKPNVSVNKVINKFSLTHNKKINLETDEVIDDDSIIKDDDEFNPSFDDVETIKEIAENEIDLEAAEAARAAQLFQSGINFEDNEDEVDEDEAEQEQNEDEYEEDEEEQLSVDNIVIEDEDEYEEDEEEQLSVDNIVIEDEDEEYTSDSIIIEDEDEYEEDEEDEEEEYTLDNIVIEGEDNIESEDNEEDQEQLGLNNIVIEDEDNDGFYEEDEDYQNTLEQSINNININIDDEEDEEPEQEEINIDDEEPEQEEINIEDEEPEQEEINNTAVNSEDDITDSEIESLEKELEQLRKDKERQNLRNKKIAELKKQIQDIKSCDTDNVSEIIEENKNKNEVDDNVDKLINSAKKSANTVKNKGYSDNDIDKFAVYTAMSTEALYARVKEKMIEFNVNIKPVDISKLNDIFGPNNIKKLLQKSYLIKVGKGVTTGR